MHSLTSVRYLESCEKHLHLTHATELRAKRQQSMSASTSPQNGIPIQTLLPANLEVLKYAPLNFSTALIRGLLRRKLEDKHFLPCLRSIILCYHYRDRIAAQDLAQERFKSGQDTYYKSYPTWTKRASLSELHVIAGLMGIEVVPVYEDIELRDMLRIVNPAVWELADQSSKCPLKEVVVEEGIRSALLKDSRQYLDDLKDSQDSEDEEDAETSG